MQQMDIEGGVEAWDRKVGWEASNSAKAMPIWYVHCLLVGGTLVAAKYWLQTLALVEACV